MFFIEIKGVKIIEKYTLGIQWITAVFVISQKIHSHLYCFSLKDE